jgi:hypothetical protein
VNAALARLSAVALAAVLVGCGTTPPVSDPTERVARARLGLEDDPAVEAMADRVEAAVAREESETAIDEFEVRIGDAFNTENDDDTDNRVRLRARVPVPNPAELRARRDVRRAQTDAAVSRLEETALEKRAEYCLRGVETSAHRARTELYEQYASTYKRLIISNEQSLLGGRISEPIATRFEIETRIKLATSRPEPAPPDALPTALPEAEEIRAPLVTRAELVREAVRERHPSVSIHHAQARRYLALTEREQSRDRLWPEFVDFAYEANADSDRRQAGGQVAFRVPIGPSGEKSRARYSALGRSEVRLADSAIDERVVMGLIALREVDSFERDAERWAELMALARRAETAADYWWEQRLATPSQVGALLDQAHAARSTVLEARDRAAAAACALLVSTGVSLEEWPRE